MSQSNQLLVLVFGCLFIQSINLNSCRACVEGERQALLNFKLGLEDPSDRLSSWVGRDCCRWRGVGCENGTGHVIWLDLHNRYPVSIDENSLYKRRSLRGEINPSLLELKHLEYLDLSKNDFEGMDIPEFIGSLRQLTYLNLSNAGFGGRVPEQLGNLTSLRYLSLSSHLNPTYFLLPELNSDSLGWVSHLHSLRHLDLRNVNLREATDWLNVVNLLPSLSELWLSSCKFNYIPPLPRVNFTSLSVLDLAQNSINSTIPCWLSNISGLVHLDLNFNHFRGPISTSLGNLTSLEVLDLSENEYIEGAIPATLGNLCSLRRLDLSMNNITRDIVTLIERGCFTDSLQFLGLNKNRLRGYLPNSLGRFRRLQYLRLSSNLFTGVIPSSIGGLSSLRELQLGRNKLNGTVPTSLGQLSELADLRLSDNLLEGIVSEAHFSKLTKLEILFMSSNSLALNLSSDWVPPFQLNFIDLGSCKLGPQFPAWLRTQKSILGLDISNAEISDQMPDWFWKSSSNITYLDLSKNQIKGKVPSLLKYSSLSIIILSSNLFEGPLPHFPSNLEVLDLSENFFSGPIFSRIGEKMWSLQLFSLSDNLINGSIPLSLCKMNSLVALDLSKNRISGGLPNCFWESPDLKVIDFSNNNLSGVIPTSFGSLKELESLHLSNNHLLGELTPSLKNCTELVTLDLGGNKFSGNLPSWIGEVLSQLVILRLRSNKFYGVIPPQLSQLTSLQVLDLAHNNLSGTISSSFSNFSAMAVESKKLEPIINTLKLYEEHVLVATKGMELEYTKTLPLLTGIDLSSNSLSGEIPPGLMNLYGLRLLNLSMNSLSGTIPKDITNLRWLESLDFSLNKLSGSIPPSISALTSLSLLNLSNNNLVGKIPSGNQFQTFNDPSIYLGNRDLCGPPLTQKCPGDGPMNQGPVPSGAADEGFEDGGEFEMQWFYIGIGLGFVVGFWGLLGTLLFKNSWRVSYFLFFDKIKNRLLEPLCC